MKKILEMAVILLGTMGWWGFVYPELCLLDISYEEEYCCETQEDKAQEGMDAGTEDMLEIPEAFEVIVKVPVTGCEGPSDERKVRIKSKIAEYVYQVRNREAEKEKQDDE